VGLPNVGKSSLFNLLTDQSTAAENFPFCTIDPSDARCAVPDERCVAVCVAVCVAMSVAVQGNSAFVL